ncbi:MAG: hypothetical protein OEM38_11605 [Gammaproteobacteria bacterium]|nr:hypothetical protein [Gammaproteobacteria bacterium]
MKNIFQTFPTKIPLISRWLLISLVVALLHISFDHYQVDLHDSTSICDICRLAQIDTPSAEKIAITLDKYSRTDFSPETQPLSFSFSLNTFARAPPAFI